jgi:hypothetical protein
VGLVGFKNFLRDPRVVSHRQLGGRLASPPKAPPPACSLAAAAALRPAVAAARGGSQQGLLRSNFLPHPPFPCLALVFGEEGWPAPSKMTGDEPDPCPLGPDLETFALDLPHPSGVLPSRVPPRHT